MASRVSSEPFKPAKLPVVGTTWVRRGAAYWARRVSLHLFVFVGFGGIAAIIIYGFFDLVGGVGSPWRAVLEVLYCALSAGGFVWGWAWTLHKVRIAREDPAAAEEGRRKSAAVQRNSTGLAMAGRLPALILFPFLAPLILWALGMVMSGAFMRVLPVEVEARRRWESQRSGSTRPSARSR
jgi:hypothetical protein